MSSAKTAAVKALFDVAPSIVRSVGCGVANKEEGLTFQQIRTIMYVAEQPRFLGEIAKERSVSPASASALVDGLETDGYLLRTMDRVDRRRIVVTLTDKGRKAYENTRAMSEAMLSELVQHLGEDDAQQLAAILGKLV